MDTNASGTWQNKMLGRYRLLRLLGRGGMGEVWLAEDTQLLRQVAIKLLPTVLAADRSYLEDFAREARAAAALEHPHILPVHDFGEQQLFGEDEVVTYLVTPYMSGGSLRERILAAQGPLPPTEVTGYLRQAAEAIDYAHSQQVLHRDIKPANMLLGQSWLFLADFGIAKLLTSTTQRNRTYAGAGTPEYMAPEQIRGKAEAASDRYSFAVTAYQLVTGHVPFKGETPYSTLIMQMTEEPASPRRFNPELPEAVERAILWGLAKNPTDRPASCIALVHALEHGWQMHIPPQLDPEATQLSSWNKPTMGASSPSVRPLAPSATPVIQSAMTPQLPVTNPPLATRPSANAPTAPETSRTYGPNDPTYLSGSAEAAQQREERQQGKITRRAVLAGAATAAVAVAAGGTALFLHSHSTPTTPVQHVAKPAPGPKKLIAGIPLLSLTGHSLEVNVVSWHPGGRYLVTGGEDSLVLLWDVGGNIQPSSNSIQSLSTPIRRWKLPENILANYLCWSNDGRTLAAVAGDNKIYLIDASVSGSTPTVYQDSSASGSTTPAYVAIAWSPVANTFATPSYVQNQTQQVVDIWQLGHSHGPLHILTSNATGTARTALIDIVHATNATASPNAVSWSNDGSLLAAHTNFGSVIIWQAATGAMKETLSLPVRQTQDHPHDVLNECLAWSPVRANLLAVSNIDLATLWDVQQNKQLLALKNTDSAQDLTGLAWSPNGSYLAGSYARLPRIYVWDVQTLLSSSGTGADQNSAQAQKLFFPQSGTRVHTATITDIAWSPDGRYIATSSGDTTAVVWKVDGG